jgi:hypothetical protein
VVLDFAAVSLPLLDDESEAFLATRATIIAGQPDSDTITGTAISHTAIFTNLFIVFCLHKNLWPRASLLPGHIDKSRSNATSNHFTFC